MNTRNANTTAACIDKYINTSFDVIKKVADNLEVLKDLANISDLSDVLTEVNEMLASVDTTIAQINSSLSSKQNSLVAGTNIKFINGQSILGAGNMVIMPPVEVTGVTFKNGLDDSFKLSYMGI